MDRPTLAQLASAVHLVASIIGAGTASYCFDGRIAIPVSDRWSLVLSSDDADRVRLDACRLGRVRGTMWCDVRDRDRLAELAEAIRDEAAALAA